MKETIAQHLLDIEAVTLRPNDPFTWSSGIKSPIYCDNRLTMGYPHIRQSIAEGFEQLIRSHFPEVTVVAGTATAGIPHAAWVSDRLQAPMVYVRSKSKGHGKQNQIEGKLSSKDRVVIIEDLISTGGSVIQAADALREAGADVLGVVAIFTYGLEKGQDQLEAANLPSYVLTDYPTLLDVAIRRGDISEEELQKLQKWRENPSSQSWMNE
ncbi:orotate phosphoribosyltransferase [Halalkalibacterium halodurans]|jgi:orotate phosphoribosyltransferase|uniref:Orotate phosphoribosyltransferase n=2 Tax=Halalkalibacterium halodurans TaxID=86665 RepID=PYRE_HALH5|nr:orotate phosphoribosyltransferase [Halalkalibacterium halodurans]Q9K9W3.1 RecName: Full=Orotate phosphoribosyltransferase; Short=OPRT; Short=OPRTase [Halalkalibacterium halodurans C-125]MDY7223070.1 orotate phosphoribosyltransferase [Halalkalibacterium halodurans]MDY7242291.1 orotate phosphoribosyltransferase [Halalkalibacterium halodurans]MED3646162.1 orotate phosphoribosyltransferase [Halalkalibacterium halodurans]MED4079678.1 orotate phosphoribosyltransferase [Halalkalibacterium halodura